MAVTEFPGQKLSLLREIYDGNQVSWTKTLSFT